jgi:hypothetical protein
MVRRKNALNRDFDLDLNLKKDGLPQTDAMVELV